MPGRKPLPSEDLVDKVITIAEVRARMPLATQGLLAEGLGVYCVVRRVPFGGSLYQAGGTYRPRLSFTVWGAGDIRVAWYHPGDWEDKISEAYERAKDILAQADRRSAHPRAE